MTKTTMTKNDNVAPTMKINNDKNDNVAPTMKINNDKKRQ